MQSCTETIVCVLPLTQLILVGCCGATHLPAIYQQGNQQLLW